mmetsp:Transcript_30829/g.95217  ORF Transcript_30829/g.95217 Transcript_30829/m.95217 type:complete len:214 (-) Transcript_30829:446-1087(-)
MRRRRRRASGRLPTPRRGYFRVCATQHRPHRARCYAAAHPAHSHLHRRWTNGCSLRRRLSTCRRRHHRPRWRRGIRRRWRSVPPHQPSSWVSAAGTRRGSQRLFRAPQSVGRLRTAVTEATGACRRSGPRHRHSPLTAPSPFRRRRAPRRRAGGTPRPRRYRTARAAVRPPRRASPTPSTRGASRRILGASRRRPGRCSTRTGTPQHRSPCAR